MEGIRKGQVMFDGMSISFTEREILYEAWRFPWMEDFFDTEKEEKDCVFWSCKEWAVSMILALGDCTGEQPSMEEWIQGAVDGCSTVRNRGTWNTFLTVFPLPAGAPIPSGFAGRGRGSFWAEPLPVWTRTGSGWGCFWRQSCL